MADLNQCTFTGCLGKDPEIKIATNGKKSAKFSIAVSEKYKKQSGETVDNTQWINIVCWENVAGIAERFLKKGSRVCITGKLSNRTWDDQTTGQKKYVTEIIVRELIMVGEKSSHEDANGNSNQSYSSATTNDDVINDDDLPF